MGICWDKGAGPLIRVILIGGRIDAVVGAVSGTQARRDIASMAADVCFFGACIIAAAINLEAIR